MKVKMILPALTEATSPFWRPIKYSLFPPLGLATLAGYLSADDEIEIQDEHVEQLRLDDEPDLVVIQVLSPQPPGLRAPTIIDARRARGAGRTARYLTARRGRAARRHDFSRPRRDTWPVRRRLSRRSSGTRSNRNSAR
jgi:hypothetical protein